MFDKRLKKKLFFIFLLYISTNAFYLVKPAIFNEKNKIIRFILLPSFVAKDSGKIFLNFIKSIVDAKKILKENEDLRKNVDALYLENMFLKKDFITITSLTFKISTTGTT